MLCPENANALFLLTIAPSVSYSGYVQASGFFEYAHWFIPQGITGNYSFPSGHTAMAWMLLPLLIPLRTKLWKNPIRIVGTILIIGWGIFVGLSRIAIGAHYASDVLFSTGIAILVTFLLYQKYYTE